MIFTFQVVVGLLQSQPSPRSNLVEHRVELVVQRAQLVVGGLRNADGVVAFVRNPLCRFGQSKIGTEITRCNREESRIDAASETAITAAAMLT